MYRNKPYRWNWHPAQVEPQFRQILRGLRWIMPVWNGELPTHGVAVYTPRGVHSLRTSTYASWNGLIRERGYGMNATGSPPNTAAAALDLPTALRISGTQEFTMLAAFKHLNPAANRTLVSQRDTTSTNNTMRFMYTPSNTVRAFTFATSLTRNAESAATLVDGTNYVAVCVRNATGLYVYLDGLLVASDTSGTNASITNARTMSVFSDARDNAPINLGYTAAMWDRALSTSEISRLTNYYGLLRRSIPYTIISTTPASQLDGTLFTKAPTFPTGALSAGSVTSTGTLFTKAPTFPTGTVTGGTILAGTLFTTAPTFPTGTVTAGSVTVTGGATFQTAPTFPTGAVTGGNVLTGSVYQQAPTFPTGSLTAGAVTSNGTLYTVAPTFPTGALTETGVMALATITLTVDTPTVTITIPMSTNVIIGTTVTATATFRNVSDKLADPNTVTATLKDPAGTITNPTASMESTGVYIVPCPITTEGIWYLRVAGDGNSATVATETTLFGIPSSVD